MKALPKYIKDELARIDPWLRAEFNPGQGAWLIVRLHGAPMRGRRSFMPPNRFVKICGGMYDMRRSGELVMKITRDDDSYIDIEEAWGAVKHTLRKTDTWNRDMRSGKIIEEREKRAEAYRDAEDEAETLDDARTLGKLTDPWIDMGGKDLQE